MAFAIRSVVSTVLLEVVVVVTSILVGVVLVRWECCFGDVVEFLQDIVPVFCFLKCVCQSEGDIWEDAGELGVSACQFLEDLLGFAIQFQDIVLWEQYELEVLGWGWAKWWS